MSASKIGGRVTSFKQVMFLCSGNYYRSRYAEILFNWKAETLGLPWRAFSRGLEIDGRNPGPISQHTRAAVTALAIPLAQYLRFPQSAANGDFEQADYVVAVKEAEHRPLMMRKFPQWLKRVEFWQVDDLDCCGPEQTLPHLDRELARLIDRLTTPV
jgi:protein-tyrosine phosphatase